VAALIAYDGLYSFADAAHFMVGPEIMKLVGDGLDKSDAEANDLIKEIMTSRTNTFGPASRGYVVFGKDSPRIPSAPSPPTRSKATPADHLPHPRPRRRE